MTEIKSLTELFENQFLPCFASRLIDEIDESTTVQLQSN